MVIPKDAAPGRVVPVRGRPGLRRRLRRAGRARRLTAAGAGGDVRTARRRGRRTGQVRLADGTVVAYRIVAREFIDKQALPVANLFSRDGPPRLTLITCGGDYDRAGGGYQDNVVVTAIPESPVAPAACGDVDSHAATPYAWHRMSTEAAGRFVGMAGRPEARGRGDRLGFPRGRRAVPGAGLRPMGSVGLHHRAAGAR